MIAEADAEALRRRLLAGEIGIAELAREAGVRLAADGLLYIGHWITPEPEPRRYDTRTFLAAVSPESACAPHAAEMVDHAWLPPAEAVARWRAGDMKMLPPTVKTLERIAGFASVAKILESLRDEPVRARMPVMQRRPDGIAIILRDAG
jgi:hypothetical protein